MKRDLPATFSTETQRFLSGCAAPKQSVIRIMEFGHAVRFTGMSDIKELGGKAGKRKFDFVRGELEPRCLRVFHKRPQ